MQLLAKPRGFNIFSYPTCGTFFMEVGSQRARWPPGGKWLLLPIEARNIWNAVARVAYLRDFVYKKKKNRERDELLAFYPPDEIRQFHIAISRRYSVDLHNR